MRIIAMTNEGQLPMMKNMLNSAMKVGMDMSNFHCYLLKTHEEAAAYNTSEFKSITIRKLEVILENVKQYREVLWIDNDIVLFENCVEDIRKYRGNLVMQNDLWSPCTGFFLARSSPGTIRTLEKCIQWLHYRPNLVGVNDQHAFNATYKNMVGLGVICLPVNEYPNGKVYFDDNNRSEAKIVHNNFLVTTSEKVDRFKSFGLWNDSDDAFLLVNKHFI